MRVDGNDIINLGWPKGPMIGLILKELSNGNMGMSKKDVFRTLKKVLKDPKPFVSDPKFGTIAKKYDEITNVVDTTVHLLGEGKPYTVYGDEGIEYGAKEQLIVASKLPVAVQGALMPDAHQGYGLPIGGVLATEGAVIPYGVGVDIGCRMCLTVYPEPVETIGRYQSQMKKALLEHTAFGTGSEPTVALEDEVLDRKIFDEFQILRSLKDVAARQIGSSGGGNHFVEWGYVDISDTELGVEPGRYLAILTHSGSRGLGANIANFYTKLAKEKCKLEKHAAHLAYLDLNTEAGQEYWIAMNLAGDYASACHDHIHRKLQKAMGFKEMLRIENHHNFAWKEELNGKEVVVHRKGATPAQEGVLGIIPGSMLSPGYIVRGKGHSPAINSASHGAGRVMSRTQGNNTFTMGGIKKLLKSNGIELIGGGPDEAPGVYKDIDQVMKHQEHLVETVGKFYPKIVRMA